MKIVAEYANYFCTSCKNLKSVFGAVPLVFFVVLNSNYVSAQTISCTKLGNSVLKDARGISHGLYLKIKGKWKKFEQSSKLPRGTTDALFFIANGERASRQGAVVVKISNKPDVWKNNSVDLNNIYPNAKVKLIRKRFKKLCKGRDSWNLKGNTKKTKYSTLRNYNKYVDNPNKQNERLKKFNFNYTIERTPGKKLGEKKDNCRRTDEIASENRAQFRFGKELNLFARFNVSFSRRGIAAEDGDFRVQLLRYNRERRGPTCVKFRLTRITDNTSIRIIDLESRLDGNSPQRTIFSIGER